MSGLESLYQELILDHAKRPHGRGLAEVGGAADRTADAAGPVAGGSEAGGRDAGSSGAGMPAAGSDAAGPRFAGSPATAASADSHQRNPICGDEITLRVRTDGDTIVDATWEGQGCSISQASASMLSDLVGGLGRDEASALIDGFRDALRSRGTVTLDVDDYGDAAALSGVSKYTARVKCAMLAWVALEDALTRA